MLTSVVLISNRPRRTPLFRHVTKIPSPQLLYFPHLQNVTPVNPLESALTKTAGWRIPRSSFSVYRSHSRAKIEFANLFFSIPYALFQVPYPVTLLFATLTKRGGVVGFFPNWNSTPTPSPCRHPFLFRLHLWHVFFHHRLQFPPHHVRGKPCPQQAPVNGSHFLLIDLPAIRPQLPLDPLAHHRALIGFLRRFVQRRLDMPIRDAASAEVAGNAEFSLLAPFGALPCELLRVPRVVDLAIFP